MIKLIKQGKYKLIETKGQTKILTLGTKYVYAWIFTKEIGEILITTHKAHKIDHVLSSGEFRLYNIKDEPKLADLMHLELSVGENAWQGYLLLTGLPEERDKRKRIIPTNEVITEKFYTSNKNNE